MSYWFSVKFSVDTIFTVHYGILDIASIYKFMVIGNEPIEHVSIYIASYEYNPIDRDIIPRNYWQWNLFIQSLINFNSLPNWIYCYFNEEVIKNQTQILSSFNLKIKDIDVFENYSIKFCFRQNSVYERNYSAINYI
jgi:hypothetical protein